MTAEFLLRGVLAMLAAYHLGMGLVALVSPSAAGRLSGVLYSLHVAETPALRYGTRMLGLYAIAIGSLLVVAARAPEDNVEIIVMVAALQLARAITRLAFRRDLSAAFSIPARRNAINAVILIAESFIIAVCLWVTRQG